MKKFRFDDFVFSRKLTLAGFGLCAGLGFAIEILVFAFSGINARLVSPVVLLFLWLLSGIIVSGIVFLSASLIDAHTLLLQDHRLESDDYPDYFSSLQGSLTDTDDDDIISICNFRRQRHSYSSAA